MNEPHHLTFRHVAQDAYTVRDADTDAYHGYVTIQEGDFIVRDRDNHILHQTEAAGHDTLELHNEARRVFESHA